MAQLLDGKALARQLQDRLADHIQQWRPVVGRPPGLAVIMVGDNPASAAYVRNKERACDRIGIASFGHHLPASTPADELHQLIHQLNQNDQVDGILLQLPLPDHLEAPPILQTILPEKDVDGLHPVNMGRLMRHEPGLRSCTPAGIMELLKAHDIDPTGRQAVVVGRSILVGRPMAMMLINANATVTVAHSRTADLAAVTRQADILIAAVGRTNFITSDMVKPGSIVIDVGINRVMEASGKAQLCGDVDFAGVQSKAAALTPVPGGVGPMTVAMLLSNTVASYAMRVGVEYPPTP